MHVKLSACDGTHYFTELLEAIRTKLLPISMTTSTNFPPSLLSRMNFLCSSSQPISLMLRNPPLLIYSRLPCSSWVPFLLHWLMSRSTQTSSTISHWQVGLLNSHSPLAATSFHFFPLKQNVLKILFIFAASTSFFLFWILSTQAFLFPTLQKQLLSRSTMIMITTCRMSGHLSGPSYNL